MTDGQQTADGVVAFTGATTQYDIAGTPVEFLKRDMFTVVGDDGRKPDAYLIPQFPNKAADGGVALALLEAHDDYNDQEYKAWLEKLGGDVSSSSLSVIPVYDDKLNITYYNCITVVPHLLAGAVVYRAVLSALNDATSQKLRHVVIPPLSTGLSTHLEYDQSARVIAKAIFDFAQKLPDDMRAHMPKITISVWDVDAKERDAIYSKFIDILASPEEYMNYDVEDIGERNSESQAIRRMRMEKIRGISDHHGIRLIDTTGRDLLDVSDVKEGTTATVTPLRPRENAGPGEKGPKR